MKSRLISNRFKYVRPTRAFRCSWCHFQNIYRFACFNKFQIVKKFVWIVIYVCASRVDPKKKFVILSGDCDYFNYNNMRYVVAVVFYFFFLLLYISMSMKNFWNLKYYKMKWFSECEETRIPEWDTFSQKLLFHMHIQCMLMENVGCVRLQDILKSGNFTIIGTYLFNPRRSEWKCN